jgi:ketosteroid isomerase-like protein
VKRVTENQVAGNEPARTVALAWLMEMETCVRTVDYERCRKIFADDVVGFGTKAALVVGMERLEREQWRQIWGGIRAFTFMTSNLHCRRSGDMLWLACPWTSERPGGNGAWQARPGRITAILEQRDGIWLAVHTHHSLVPRTE